MKGVKSHIKNLKSTNQDLEDFIRNFTQIAWLTIGAMATLLMIVVLGLILVWIRG